MAEYTLEITLLSDTTFARGDGVAGVVDQDVEQDMQTGLPIIKGRTLKGLLVEECANVLYSLQQADSPGFSAMLESAYRLFGVPGGTITGQGQAILHIGQATLPPEVVQHVLDKKYDAYDVLNALTTIRQQTAVNPGTDMPMDNTLRSIRAVVRGTVFLAPVDTDEDLTRNDQALLAACAASLQRAGHNRNRGRGRIHVQVLDANGDVLSLQPFTEIITGGRA